MIFYSGFTSCSDSKSVTWGSCTQWLRNTYLDVKFTSLASFGRSGQNQNVRSTERTPIFSFLWSTYLQNETVDPIFLLSSHKDIRHSKILNEKRENLYIVIIPWTRNLTLKFRSERETVSFQHQFPLTKLESRISRSSFKSPSAGRKLPSYISYNYRILWSNFFRQASMRSSCVFPDIGRAITAF